MSNKPYIAVLDANVERVGWLADTFGDVAHIAWYTTARDFEGSVAGTDESRIAALVFDYQLATESAAAKGPEDRNGHTGRDAVFMLPRHLRHVPALVWAQSLEGADLVRTALQRRDFTTIHCRPYQPHELPNIREVLARALEDHL